MEALKSLVQPLVGSAGGSSIIDGAKLVVLGGTVETARRMSSSAWSHFVNSFFLTAHFSEEDYPYDWLMLWLSRRPEWQRCREFETTTRTTTPGFSTNSFADVEEEEEDDDAPGRPKTRVVFQPTFDTSHTIYYRGHWLRVRRSRKNDGSGCEMLSISVVARNNSILKQLVLQAKREYEAESVHRIQIYFADTHGGWRWTDSRHKRPMSSIVLNPGVKEMLVNDTKDFLKSEKWYADRGIPFRRGYLLYGVPGSGKSSLIHAIAGELGLDIYTLSLSSSWISDATLTALMGRVPARCIVLLEDLDAAFTRSVSRTGNGNDAKNGDAEEGEGEKTAHTSSNNSSGRRRHRDQLTDVNTLSLSGLLNALDGVAAAEGRILFATTNHLERLDPALTRVGRMDVWIEFRNASKWQAEALFRNFFPSADDDRDGPLDPEDISLDAGELAGIDIPSPPALSDSSELSSPSLKSMLWSMASNLTNSTTSLASAPSSPTSTVSSGLQAALGTRPSQDTFGSQNKIYLPPPVAADIAACAHSAKPLDNATLGRLAKTFADAIPEEEFSVAALQGYLLKNKAHPETAANGAGAWVQSEQEMRERLQREKELKEVKDKSEREKRKKELADKEAEKAELEKKEAELARLKAQLQEHEAKEKEKINNSPSNHTVRQEEAEPKSSSVPKPSPSTCSDRSGSEMDKNSTEDSDSENVPPEVVPPSADASSDSRIVWVNHPTHDQQS